MGLFDRNKEEGNAAVADNHEQRFDQLKQKYASVLRLMEQNGVRLQNLHVENNKLYVRGEAPSEQVKNKVWDQIKQIDPAYTDLMADLTADPDAHIAASAQGGPANGGETHTVKPGDTLAKLAKHYYGHESAYMEIFHANQDQLKDPDKIFPGQQLVIPPKG